MPRPQPPRAVIPYLGGRPDAGGSPDAGGHLAAGAQSPPGFGPEHVQALLFARQRFARIRSAIWYATFDGWTLAIFAGLTFICGVFDWTGFPLGAALGVIAFLELRGARDLKRLDISAPQRLAWNQLMLALVLSAYFGWCIYGALRGTSALQEAMQQAPELAGTFGGVDQTVRTVTAAVYALLLVSVDAGLLLTAWFYRSRDKHLRAYIQQTPAWVQEMQRSGVELR